MQVQADALQNRLDELKGDIFDKIKEFQTVKAQLKAQSPQKFIGYAGAVYDHEELIAMTDTMLDGWFALGKRGKLFADKLSEFVQTRHTVLTNSGSSANLVAISSLLSPELPNPLQPGDEVITPACTFPTTLNPIIQNGLVPVFVDVDLGSYNMNLDQVENAISDKTRAIFFAHTLANPVNMARLMEIANKHQLIVIEDCCDAIGSTYNGQNVGTFGLLSTCSFYPAHHLTTAGEGGAVFVNAGQKVQRIVYSFTNWGRACWCSSDEKNPLGACNARFNFKVDGIAYDHKFLYSHIGYNLKPTEIQVAMGLAQLEKLPDFIAARKRNFYAFHQGLSHLSDALILPQWEKAADPSWFAFPMTVREDMPFSREDLVHHLEENGIQTRNLFAGNILRHPAYRDSRWEVRAELKNSDLVMKNTFFVGVYPGLSEANIEFIIDSISSFVRGRV
ncbi:lipopolysaccharide biosynthesis protein RfbH [Alicyclobacillus fodiniaquatilis]|jgi:CDP-6-deoxy-D-xylo-4-hexulose-3-dehydrase|uniref:Lipopolysaccharide biosynthesis protein RfbH n=1 Tax=Alicyclobacillus fodiniaquatilis TaxID=1661150 RepID=A0ABW4JF05_9BACL